MNSAMDVDAVDLLKRLIACPSLTPASAGSLELIAELFTAAGFRLQRLPAGGVENLLAVRGEEGAVPKLLFAGHVDVVPPGDAAQWESDPFTPVERDGQLYGRGAADMKSGVAAMVAAALGGGDAGGAMDGVAVFLTSDEEGTAVHGTRHFVEWWQAQGRAQIPYCIVGEPTCEQVFGDAIKVGRRGSLTCRVTIRGRQGHAAYAYRADNPAHRLARALQRQADAWQDNLQAQAAGEMVTTFQVVALEGGVGATNVTPPHAGAVFNFRYAPPHTAAQLQEEVAAVFDEVAADRWHCEWEHSAAPYIMPSDSRLPLLLREVVQRHTGQAAAFTTSGGTSDGRFLRAICGEMAEFGVCNATIHEPNENVRIADVRALAAIYGDIIRALL